MKIVKDLVPADVRNIYRYEQVNPDGSSKNPPVYMYLKYAPGSLAQEATPVNSDLFNTLQGYENRSISFDEDGNITETDRDTGATRKVTFSSDGKSITEVLRDGEKTITKTTIFHENGNIEEVIS